MPTLSFVHLKKTYTATIATDDVSFDVRSGEVFGLLGPNGAGKSTLLRMLMDILVPDEGSIVLDGQPVTRAERDRIGYLPEERGLYKKEKVIDVLIYFGMLKGLSRAAAKARALEGLARFELGEMAQRRTDQMSKGQQQKVQIIGTLLHEPSVLVMDEPFTGLDPINTVLVKDLLRERSRKGAIVILSTHQMPLVEELCDRVAMIDHGKLVLYGDLEEIRRGHGEASVLVDAAGPLEGIPGVVRTAPAGRHTRVFLAPGTRPRDLLATLAGRGIAVDHFEVMRTPLEEIFVATVRARTGALPLPPPVPAAAGNGGGAR